MRVPPLPLVRAAAASPGPVGDAGGVGGAGDAGDATIAEQSRHNFRPGYAVEKQPPHGA